MYIIDNTYFIKDTSIPNVVELQSATNTGLDLYIDEYVRLLLKRALGQVLFTEFDAFIVNGSLPNTAPQKWQDLINGVVYVKDGKSYKWQGLIYTEGLFKASLLADFTFYHWLKENISSITGIGEVRIEAKNAAAVNSNQRLVTVWNRFLVKYQGNYETCRPLRYTYKGVLVTDYTGGYNDDGYVSLITFLSDNETNYLDAALTRYGVQNQLGL